MSLQGILEELRNQRTQIEQAIGALEGTRRLNRPAKANRTKHRHMSAVALAWIGAAKKAWWRKEKRMTAGRNGRLKIIKRSPMGSVMQKEALDANGS
jgi:hypothetical protein